MVFKRASYKTDIIAEAPEIRQEQRGASTGVGSRHPKPAPARQSPAGMFADSSSMQCKPAPDQQGLEGACAGSGSQRTTPAQTLTSLALTDWEWVRENAPITSNAGDRASAVTMLQELSSNVGRRELSFVVQRLHFGSVRSLGFKDLLDIMFTGETTLDQFLHCQNQLQDGPEAYLGADGNARIQYDDSDDAGGWDGTVALGDTDALGLAPAPVRSDASGIQVKCEGSDDLSDMGMMEYVVESAPNRADMLSQASYDSFLELLLKSAGYVRAQMAEADKYSMENRVQIADIDFECSSEAFLEKFRAENEAWRNRESRSLSDSSMKQSSAKDDVWMGDVKSQFSSDMALEQFSEESEVKMADTESLVPPRPILRIWTADARVSCPYPVLESEHGVWAAGGQSAPQQSATPLTPGLVPGAQTVDKRTSSPHSTALDSIRMGGEILATDKEFSPSLQIPILTEAAAHRHPSPTFRPTDQDQGGQVSDIDNSVLQVWREGMVVDIRTRLQMYTQNLRTQVDAGVATAATRGNSEGRLAAAGRQIRVMQSRIEILEMVVGECLQLLESYGK